MTARPALRVWLAAALLLAACERGSVPAAATGNEGVGATSAQPASGQAQFPALTGRVVDQAELLTPDEEASLTERLAALEDRTTDQLVVATIPSLAGRTVEDYSDSLADRWRIGQAGKDNGVLLLVAPNERRTRIAIGYGLEGIISNARAQQIIDGDLLPAFRERRWKDGISSGVDSIVAILVENEDAPRGRRR